MNRNTNYHPRTIPAPKGQFRYRDAVITFRHRGDGALLAKFRTPRWTGTTVAHFPQTHRFFTDAEMYRAALINCRFID